MPLMYPESLPQRCPEMSSDPQNTCRIPPAPAISHIHSPFTYTKFIPLDPSTDPRNLSPNLLMSSKSHRPEMLYRSPSHTPKNFSPRPHAPTHLPKNLQRFCEISGELFSHIPKVSSKTPFMCPISFPVTCTTCCKNFFRIPKSSLIVSDILYNFLWITLKILLSRPTFT